MILTEVLDVKAVHVMTDVCCVLLTTDKYGVVLVRLRCVPAVHHLHHRVSDHTTYTTVPRPTPSAYHC